MRMLNDAIAPESDRFFVMSPAQQAAFMGVEKLINQIDRSPDATVSPTPFQAIQVTRVFRPRAADVTSLSRILTNSLARRSVTGAMVPTVNVTVDAGTQSLVVTGSPGDVQQASDLMEQLDPASGLPGQMRTKFMDVGGPSEVRRLAPLVEQLYRDQVSDRTGTQLAHAKILSSTESGQLIVTASDEHLNIIEAILSQLKTDQAQPQPRRLQILSLQNLRVDSSLKSITDLVGERMLDKAYLDMPKPLLLPDVVNNRLLVTATDAQFKEVEQVVRALDLPPEKSKREIAMIPVSSKPAAELVPLLSQLLGQAGEEPVNPQLAPRLMPDATGRQILAFAMPADLERIRSLVLQLDGAPSASARQLRTVELFNRTGTDLAPLVQQLYTEQLKGQPEPLGGRATILAGGKPTQILLSGPEKEVTTVEAIIRQLDPAGRPAVREETRVIRLKTAQAAELASLVEKSLAARAEQVKVLVDARSNSLVITGDSAAVESASQIIQQLDTRPDLQPRELQDGQDHPRGRHPLRRLVPWRGRADQRGSQPQG